MFGSRQRHRVRRHRRRSRVRQGRGTTSSIRHPRTTCYSAARGTIGSSAAASPPGSRPPEARDRTTRSTAGPAPTSSSAVPGPTGSAAVATRLRRRRAGQRPLPLRAHPELLIRGSRRANPGSSYAAHEPPRRRGASHAQATVGAIDDAATLRGTRTERVVNGSAARGLSVALCAWIVLTVPGLALGRVIPNRCVGGIGLWDSRERVAREWGLPIRVTRSEPDVVWGYPNAWSSFAMALRSHAEPLDRSRDHHDRPSRAGLRHRRRLVAK